VISDVDLAISTLMYGDGKPPPAAGLILCSPQFLAIYNAERDFYGRNWRRVKREVRKALLKVRIKQRGKPQGINRGSASWWRNAYVQ